MNGVIIIDKPEDFTSHDVAAKLRGMLHTKKIGHGGTLDPKATGVLPVFVGNATKLCDFLLCEEKTYEAEITFGIATDTEDIWGNVKETQEVELTEDEAIQAIQAFVGTYDQVPPMYSAKKVDGKKLYDLARQGIEIERKAVPVEIKNIEILGVSLPKVQFRVSCSKGTYIRTLCKDIGEKIGIPSCMSALRRVQHGHFTIDEAVTLKTLQYAVDLGNAHQYVIPTEALFPEAEKLYCTEEGARALANGNKLKRTYFKNPQENPDGSYVRIYDMENEFKAIYAYDEKEGVYTAVKMFLR